ncbi:hypothetical protein B0T16DRAFT_13174 [Cercophora newfieldiana]|uniref:Uncharacterized protein n=1 Tax=Cercophora newfieldiana TaxID=92897 RepID=A0AA39YMX7_9PEZI|nr:hypothetical protein B0T16DRAFT_13174 [Cercophora newfieldiana]
MKRSRDATELSMASMASCQPSAASAISTITATPLVNGFTHQRHLFQFKQRFIQPSTVSSAASSISSIPSCIPSWQRFIQTIIGIITTTRCTIHQRHHLSAGRIYQHRHLSAESLTGGVVQSPGALPINGIICQGHTITIVIYQRYHTEAAPSKQSGALPTIDITCCQGHTVITVVSCQGHTVIALVIYRRYQNIRGITYHIVQRRHRLPEAFVSQSTIYQRDHSRAAHPTMAPSTSIDLQQHCLNNIFHRRDHSLAAQSQPTGALPINGSIIQGHYPRRHHPNLQQQSRQHPSLDNGHIQEWHPSTTGPMGSISKVDSHHPLSIMRLPLGDIPS